MASVAEDNPPGDGSDDMRDRYQKWIDKYGREYKSGEEREKRFPIYQSNVQYIDYFNSLNRSYTLADNMFADLTNDEFKTTYLGYLTDWSPDTCFKYGNIVNLPTNVDWRKEGAVTPIKDQGQCGMNSSNL